MAVQKRQTAYKFWIKDILSAKKVTTHDFGTVFDVLGKEVWRVNLLAVVVQSYSSLDGNYTFLMLDDGSAQIRVKAWGEDNSLIKEMDVGKVVLVVGRLAETNNEIFVRPEMAKIVDPAWATVRKLELTKNFGKVEAPEITTTSEEVIDEAPIEPAMAAREKVISALEKSSEDGIELSALITSSGLREDEANKVIKELLEEGEAYQPRRGMIKLIV